MNKILYALMLIIFYNSASVAQQKSGLAKFASKVYFPFDIGLNIPINQSNFQNGFSTGFGVEYRFNIQKGIFIRADYFLSTNDFKIAANPNTNVQEGSLISNVGLIGLGYRVNPGNSRFKIAVRVEGGINLYRYPTVVNLGSAYKISPEIATVKVFQSALAIEYYLLPHFSIYLDGGYTITPDATFLWESNYQNLQIKVGINASLFNF